MLGVTGHTRNSLILITIQSVGLQRGRRWRDGGRQVFRLVGIYLHRLDNIVFLLAICLHVLDKVSILFKGETIELKIRCKKTISQ